MSGMCPSRRLLQVLTRGRRNIGTAQKQVARCYTLHCRTTTKRQLSDSAKTLSDEHDRKNEKKTSDKPTKVKSFSLNDILEEENEISESGIKQKDSHEEFQKTKTVDITDDKIKFNLSDAMPEELVSSEKVRSYKEENILEIGNTESENIVSSFKEDNIKEIRESEEIGDANSETIVSSFKEENIKEIIESEEIGNTESEGKVLVSSFEEDNSRKVGNGEVSERNNIKYQILQINLINASTSYEKVFGILLYNLKKRNVFAVTNAIIVCALRKLQKLNVTDLSEEIVASLQEYLDHRSQISRMKTTDLSNILEYFIKNSQDDNTVTFTLLHEASWRLRKCSVHDTLSIMAALKYRLGTDKRKETYQFGKERLIDHIGSVSSPQEMLTVMYMLGGNKDVQLRTEEEASVMLQSMDPVQTYRLLYLLALNKSRNYQLITKARKQLCSRPINLDMTKLKNLFFACRVLAINEQKMLHEMSVNLLDLLEHKSDADNSSITIPVLLSCSRIGWNFKHLTNVIMKDITDVVKEEKKVTDMQMASIVISLGHFNLVEHGNLGCKLAGLLNVLKSTKPGMWLNVVHSMACMKLSASDNVQEVLSEAFYQPLLDDLKDKPSFLQDNMKRKLLSLCGYLSADVQESNISIDAPASDWRNELQQVEKNAPLARLAKAVSEVMSDIAPMEKYTNRNIVTNYGCTIDFEIFLDKSLKAVRLDDAAGMQKVWIKMLDYNCFVRGDTEPEYSGSTVMMLRHLETEGDVVVVYVPYHVWSKLERKLDQLNYLETSIKSAVEASDPSTERSDGRDQVGSS